MNNLELNVNLHEKIYFQIKLLKSAFVANFKWQEEPGFSMWHHICQNVDHPYINLKDMNDNCK